MIPSIGVGSTKAKKGVSVGVVVSWRISIDTVSISNSIGLLKFENTKFSNIYLSKT